MNDRGDKKRPSRTDGRNADDDGVDVRIAEADDARRAAVQLMEDAVEARDALLESEESYHLLAETASDAIIRIDEHSIIKFVNTAATRVFGYAPKELVGHSLTMLMPEEWRKRHREGFARYLRTGKRNRSWDGIELPARHKDGHHFPLEISFGEYTRGGKRFFIGIGRDITDRKAVEAALREKEAELQMIADTTPMVLVRCTRDLRYRFINKAGADLFGLPPDEIVGKPLVKLMGKQAFAAIEPHIKKVLGGERVSFDVEMPYPAAGPRWMRANYVPEYDEGGQVVGWIASIVDITELRSAERERSEYEERFARFMRNLPGLSWIKDLEGRYVYANEAAVTAFGTTAEKLYGKTDKDVFPPDVAARFEENDRRALKIGTGTQEVETLLQGDGVLHYSIVSKFPMKGPDGQPTAIGGMAIDITEQKRIEEEIRLISRMPEENPNPVMRISEDGQILYANEASQPLLDFWQRESGLQLPRYLRIRLHEAFRVGISQEFEITFDGKTLVATIAPIREAGYVNFYGTDITERKEAEERLRMSQNQLRLVTDALPALISYVDNKERYRYVNQTYGEWFAVDKAAVIGRSTREVFGISAYRKLKPWIDVALAGREARFEALIPYKKGGPRYVHGIYVPDVGVDGSVRGYFGLTNDLTDLKRSQELLRSSEERLRLMMETFTDHAILSTDREGRVESWNVGAEHIFGYSRDEMIGQTCDRLFTPEDLAVAVPLKEMRNARLKGRASDERWHVRKDGSRFFASGVMMPLYVGKTLTGYAKIASDLTEKKRHAELMQEAHDQLEMRVAQRTRELAESNAALIQEIEQRAVAEKQRIDLLGRLVTSQEFERRRIARDLHDQLGQRLTALRLKIASLKEVSGANSLFADRVERLQEIGERLDAEVSFLAWELRPSTLDDLGLVDAVGAYVKEWSRHYEIAAEFHTSGLSGARFERDVETHLYRVTQEALNNTAKHAGAKQVSVLLEKMAENLVLIIEDDGKGFDPAAENVATVSGGGLGLTGMGERAALIGGEIEIESAPGNGTTIYVRVPAFL